MSGITTNSMNDTGDLEYYQDDQVILVAYVHNIHEPKGQVKTDQSSENSNIGTEKGKKKYANCHLQCKNNWYFARIYGTMNDILNQPMFVKMQEAEKNKKAIKLIARKGKDLGLSKNEEYALFALGV